MVYLLLRALLRHAIQVYFRRIEVEGREDVPEDGPLLLASNHPNTLIDVLLVATALDRRVGVVGKAPLFRTPILGPMLRALGGVPVERRMDGPMDEAAKKKNEQVLAACEETVAAGGAVLIFPEGTSLDEPRLQPLKTGVARIALGAETRAPGRVRVVPVALVYDQPGTFRSRARIVFGAPIDAAPFAKLEAEAEGTAAKAFTQAIRDVLEPEVVHVASPELDPVVEDLVEVYGRTVASEVGGRLAAGAAIARAVSSFAKTDPERVLRVRALLDDYKAALAKAGVDDASVRAREVRGASALEELGFVFGAPIAAWGALNHLVLYQLPRLALRLIGAESVYWSTVKLLTGLLALVACYALQTWLVARTWGPAPAGAYLATLPLAGIVALLWLEGLEARLRARRARAARARLDGPTRQALEEKRATLVKELDRARAAYLASALG